MANKTMHHVVIGADTFELVDEKGREETTSLKEDFNLYVDSGNNFIDSQFLQGSVTGISNSDVISVNANTKYRVYSTEIFKRSGIVNFLIDSDYRVYFWKKLSDNSWHGEGWYTEYSQMDATYGLVFVISHYLNGSEITDEADINVFKTKLKYITGTGEDISVNKAKINSVLESQNPIGLYYSDSVQQAYANGSWNFNPNRISIKFIEAIQEPLYVSVKSGYKYYIYECDSTGALTGTIQAWTTEDCIVPANKYMAITLAKSAGDYAISPSEIVNFYAQQFEKKSDATQTETRLGNQIASINDKVVESLIYNKVQLPFTVNQAYISNQFRDNANRISFAEPFPFNKGDKISITVGAGEKYYLMYFNKVNNTGNISTDYSYISGSGTGWQTTNKSYTATEDVYVYVMAAFAGDTAITKDTVKTKAVITKAYASEDTDALPSYWETYLQTKNDLINSTMDAIGGNGDAFVFYTDPHWGSKNQKHTPKIIQNMLENTALRSVYCGGDVIDSGSGGFSEYCKAFRGITVFTARGNHDQNPYATDPTDIVPDSEYYNRILKPIEYLVNTDGRLYFYRDNVSEKIRYIFMDSGSNRADTLDTTQLTWMQNALTELDSDWSALVIQHIVFTGAEASSTAPLNFAGQGRKTINAINAVWDQIRCTFIGIVCGHVHRDYATTDSTYGYPIIATSCDVGGTGRTQYDPVNGATPKTTDEHILDVFVIDKENKTINTIRIGAGQNRTFTYGN